LNNYSNKYVKKILITEDDQFIANIYRQKFQSEGYEADIAETGKIALQKLKAAPPDIVLLDLMLPEVYGIDVLQFIRSEPGLRDLPVIVLSNAYAGATVQAAWRAGANQCLTKANCSPNHLVEEVRSLMASRETLAAAQARKPQPSQTESASRTLAAGDTVRFTEDLHRNLKRKLVQQLRELPQLLQDFAKAGQSAPSSYLPALYRAVHAFASSAALAGLTSVAQLSSAVEALLKELHEKPKNINPSTLRTVAQAIDCLGVIFDRSTYSANPIQPLILVLDDETISRETICTALSRASLHAVGLDDPTFAVKLIELNSFDLVFLDVDMPGLNGFEVCKRLHADPANTETPVIFVTGLTDFETRVRSTLSGGIDFVAKPVLLVEVAVKALTVLLRRQANAAASPQIDGMPV
jgi:DNA-binding response OmpR family regulator